MFKILITLTLILFSSVSTVAFQKRLPQRAKGTETDKAHPPNGMLVLNVADIVERANRSVVNVQSSTQEGGTSFGSGFFVDKNGLVVTNYHVIREAISSSGAITITTSDGESYPASVKGYDDSTDIALLEIKAKGELESSVLGNSDQVRVGDWVVAIGNPFGLDHTVTLGIISAKGRSGIDGEYDDYLQTDAAINFGNSGGPLVNTKGEVIGINTLILAKGQGLGFAIPINILKEVLPQLRDLGRVRRSSLELETVDIPANLAKSLGMPAGMKGIRVVRVERETPAAKAGLRRDDIITAVNGTLIYSTGQFNRTISRIPPGSRVEIRIRRDEREFTINAEVTEKKR